MKRSLFIGMFAILPLAAGAQNYFLTKSADGVEEVYIMSVTTNRSNSTTVVLDRVKPAEGKLPDFRHNTEQAADKKAVKTGNFDKLGYYRRKIQYNCNAKTYRIMEINYYDLGGKVLETAEYEESKTPWHKIYPGSMIDVEFKKICGK